MFAGLRATVKAHWKKGDHGYDGTIQSQSLDFSLTIHSRRFCATDAAGASAWHLYDTFRFFSIFQEDDRDDCGI